IRNLYIILSYDKPNLSTFKDTFSDSLLETHFLCQSKRISIQSAAYLKLYTLKSRKNTQIDKKPESSMGSSYKPGMIMVALEFSYAALALFTKAAFTGGLSPRIFVVYRQAIATLIMSSLAFVSNRSRMEKIKIRSVRSGAKIAGTVICVLGAIAVAFLKGPKLLNYHFLGSEQDDKNWLIGCLLLFASSFFWSLWIILQVPIAATCPDLIYSSAWLCFLATTQLIGAVAVIIGLYMVLWGKAKDLEEAKMGKEKEGSAADLEEPFLTDKPTQV
ncbi:WAT1-related protein At4g28040, partial [Linum perenne]